MSYYPNTVRRSFSMAQVEKFLEIVRDNDVSLTFSSVPKLRSSVSEGYFNFKKEMTSPFGMHLVTHDATVSSTLALKTTYTTEEASLHRRCMRCDCMNFHETTWICEHAILS